MGDGQTIILASLTGTGTVVGAAPATYMTDGIVCATASCCQAGRRAGSDAFADQAGCSGQAWCVIGPTAAADVTRCVVGATAAADVTRCIVGATAAAHVACAIIRTTAAADVTSTIV